MSEQDKTDYYRAKYHDMKGQRDTYKLALRNAHSELAQVKAELKLLRRYRHAFKYAQDS